jgi:hypothetical protein
MMNSKLIRVRIGTLIAVLSVCGLPSASLAAATNAVDSAPDTATANVFKPDPSDGFDWVELISGEWLKGEIVTMHSDTLTFDSDVLDLLTIDWEDVRQVVTDNTQTVRTEAREQFSGALRVDTTCSESCVPWWSRVAWTCFRVGTDLADHCPETLRWIVGGSSGLDTGCWMLDARH